LTLSGSVQPSFAQEAMVVTSNAEHTISSKLLIFFMYE